MHYPIAEGSPYHGCGVCRSIFIDRVVFIGKRVARRLHVDAPASDVGDRHFNGIIPLYARDSVGSYL